MSAQYYCLCEHGKLSGLVALDGYGGYEGATCATELLGEYRCLFGWLACRLEQLGARV